MSAYQDNEKYGEERVEYTEKSSRRASVAEEVLDLSGIEATAASKAAWLISLTISQAGLLFGYDTGYISSVLVTLGSALGHELSHSEEELVTSLTSGGALVGAVYAGLSADKYGRKMPIWVACVLFLVGTILQTAAFSVAQFAVGRFIVGLGVGSASMIAPLFIGEIAPARYRGRMIAFNNLSVTFGQFIASCLGAGFQHAGPQGWRATVGIGAIPAITLAGLLFFVPESPRQLVAHGKVEQADRSLQKIYTTSTEQQRANKIKSIQVSLEETKSVMSETSLWQTAGKIFTNAATARAVGTACIVMAVSQLGGFNTLMYYAATLFAIAGFSNATAVAITVSATNFVFSFVNLVLVDRFGRRIILCVTILGMAICMAVAAISFHFIPISQADLSISGVAPTWAAPLLLVAIVCYVAFFSSGVATIAWIGTELIPLEVRAIGTMFNTVTCWSTNIIIASTFLSIMKGASPTGAFSLYGSICFLGWLFVIFCYPEVKGMPLESIREVFQNGFGVRYSKQWQRENKHVPKVVTQTFGH
ncbi:hypothetical protein LTR64_008639 [Lithohypha guttulata]|uniref:Major facilitator superfamily (MFS) profile domain-containing protein n=1 Tax=Lithohypha guttulata TaxID=1690604 RepID=A0AAN7T054_9EURO|nr:hypothetical protein LTR51_008754 [Lithohypha guttulata]KAK5085165.1 hypothetical protein LTR05_004444 [Lithohypha guttulata]